MPTLSGDNNFKYVYKVSYNATNETARLLDSFTGPGFGGITALLNPVNNTSGVTVTDNINNSSGSDPDNENIIGDRPNDRFTLSNAPGLNGEYRFVSAAQTGDADPNVDVGFIARNGNDYYFFTDTPLNSTSGRFLTLLDDTDQIICFMPGTAIATPTGTAAVETLAIGDLVLTSDGRAAPVRWVGRQTVSTLFADETRLPVRITAGALGDNLPVRDLLVSNDHALLVEGVLVQAGALINGSTIVRERNVPAVFTYYHVELDDHSLILAENVPAETFVDNVERYAFDNWAEHQALYPNGRSVAEMDLPRVKAHRQLPSAVRRLIAARVPVEAATAA